jgi:putative FmdB family regulatory protein
MDVDTRYRYRCNQCRRAFTVNSDASRFGSARCPACLGDDVTHWMSRLDRLMSFLMVYEAA